MADALLQVSNLETYYGKLLATAAAADTERPELREARAFR